MVAVPIAAGLISKYDMVNTFGEFLITNGVVSMAAGIVFGAATVYWIRQASVDVVLPLLNVVTLGGLRLFNTKLADKISAFLFSNNTQFRFSSFLQELIIWLVTMVIAFAVTHYAFLKIQAYNEKRASKIKEAKKRDNKDEDDG